MIDSKTTKIDLLEDLPDRVDNSTRIAFVALRLRRFGESQGLTQDELTKVLGTDREGLVKLALCYEPADPICDDFEALKQISGLTGISLDSLRILWSDLSIEEA